MALGGCGWMGGWINVSAGLRIAYSYEKEIKPSRLSSDEFFSEIQKQKKTREQQEGKKHISPLKCQLILFSHQLKKISVSSLRKNSR